MVGLGKDSAKRETPVMAVDLGGSKILVALITQEGKVLDRERCATVAAEGPQAVIERIFSLVNVLLERNNLSPDQLYGISIAAAGGIDSVSGVITLSPNLPGWEGIPLRDIMRDRYKTAVFLLNDASAAALGEHRFGAGRGTKDMVLVTVGTGIGGGIITGGELYTGSCGGAGEIGHMTIDVNGPGCACGSAGCWEELGAGRAIEREAKTRIKKGEISSLLDMAEGKIEDITTIMVDKAAQGGDSMALEIIGQAAFYLGVGLANLVNIFNPEVIVIGGGMAAMGDRLLEHAERVMRERAFDFMARSVRMVTAELGNDAGIYGAASYAFGYETGRVR